MSGPAWRNWLGTMSTACGASSRRHRRGWGSGGLSSKWWHRSIRWSGSRGCAASSRSFQEHTYTESVQVVMRQAMATLGNLVAPGDGPRVLLGTLPGEPHGLGLLMAEAMLAVHGARCISLGVQTPVWDLVLATRAYQCDIVALSFTGCMLPAQVTAALTELRAKLPAEVALWVGGAAPVLHRRPVQGVARDRLAGGAARRAERLARPARGHAAARVSAAVHPGLESFSTRGRHHDLPRTLQAARSRALEHGKGHSLGPVRCQQAQPRTGADDSR